MCDFAILTLAPGERAEIKLVMANDNAVEYEWSALGGAVNFDTHADAPGISAMQRFRRRAGYTRCRLRWKSWLVLAEPFGWSCDDNTAHPRR